MKKKLWSLMALCLAVCVLFSGCLDFGGYFDRLLGLFEDHSVTDFEDMVYTRPDMEEFQRLQADALSKIPEEKDMNALTELINSFYGACDAFYASYSLSYIYYCKDLTDTYWEGEYAFCLEKEAQVQAALDALYRALARSPLREKLDGEEYFGPGYLDRYEGDSHYDDQFVAYLEQEAQLETQYYVICAEASAVEYYSEAFFDQFGTRLAQLYVQLIRVRQDMAAYAGYESYPEYAYEAVYSRDYTPEESQTYLQQIQHDLVPLYRQLNASGYWSRELPASSETETFRYLEKMVSAMGGIVETAFRDMESAKLYDIAYGENKLDGSFETYIGAYNSPYIFVNPTGSIYDKLTFSHEFGHFCNDYVSYGSGVGLDVAEIFSQGMEYLSLCYVEDPALEKLKMADSLTTFVQQAAYASFEQQVYALEGDQLTADAVQKLYTTVSKDYGLDSWIWDGRDYVCIPHFFTEPVYVISYVVSNDLAMQFYRLEKEARGQGLQAYTQCLDTTQAQLGAFVLELEAKGYSMGNVEERMGYIRDLFATVLNEK